MPLADCEENESRNVFETVVAMLLMPIAPCGPEKLTSLAVNVGAAIASLKVMSTDATACVMPPDGDIAVMRGPLRSIVKPPLNAALIELPPVSWMFGPMVSE